MRLTNSSIKTLRILCRWATTMPTRAELASKDLAELALLCSEVAANPSIDFATREKMNLLRQERVRLQSPSHPILREQGRIETLENLLKSRMLEALADILVRG